MMNNRETKGDENMKYEQSEKYEKHEIISLRNMRSLLKTRYNTAGKFIVDLIRNP